MDAKETPSHYRLIADRNIPLEDTKRIEIRASKEKWSVIQEVTKQITDLFDKYKVSGYDAIAILEFIKLSAYQFMGEKNGQKS